MLSNKAGIIMGYELLTAVLHTSCLRLVLCGYTRQDCALDFLQDVGQSYGIDHDETAVPASDDGVSVPESRLAIPEPDLQRLKHQLDPLSNSDNYGTELYEQVVDFVVNVLQ